MKTIKLSKIPNYWELSVSEVIDFLLDCESDTIINDIPGMCGLGILVEYEISDLEDVWDNLKSQVLPQHFREI